MGGVVFGFFGGFVYVGFVDVGDDEVVGIVVSVWDGGCMVYVVGWVDYYGDVGEMFCVGYFGGCVEVKRILEGKMLERGLLKRWYIILLCLGWCWVKYLYINFLY